MAIITTGSMLSTCIDVANDLEDEGISAMVVSLHTIKPLDEELLGEIAKRSGAYLSLKNIFRPVDWVIELLIIMLKKY